MIFLSRSEVASSVAGTPTNPTLQRNAQTVSGRSAPGESECSPKTFQRRPSAQKPPPKEDTSVPRRKRGSPLTFSTIYTMALRDPVRYFSYPSCNGFPCRNFHCGMTVKLHSMCIGMGHCLEIVPEGLQLVTLREARVRLFLKQWQNCSLATYFGVPKVCLA